MTKLKISDLRKYLKEYDQKELIQLVVDLSKVSKEAQQYLDSRVNGEGAVEELHKQAEKKIENEFFPDRGMGKMRLAEAKKAISTFEKITGDEQRTVDLMLFYVEVGVEFTNTFGDIDERFYESMESMYKKVVDRCNENKGYYDIFAARLADVVRNTGNIGWGFHDTLLYFYNTIEWITEEEYE